MKHYQPQRRRLLLAAALIGLIPGLTAADGSDGPRHDDGDLVYTMTNATAGNEVLAFRQQGDGTLRPAGTFATGGAGTGAGLGNQGALTSNGKFLFVVNAGSDDISVFRRVDGRLKLADRMPSGGISPVSVTVDRNRVYVLNAGSDSIAGFILQGNGKLRALRGSERGLSGDGVGPAQIQFSPNGDTLIVTEKATNRIVSFELNHYGVPEHRIVTDSPGQTPFGFAFAQRRLLLVSEAAGGAPDASSMSSYFLRRDSSLEVLDPSVATAQTAACWVAVTPDGRHAYTTNTASNSLSTFRVGGDGQLSLEATTNSGGTGPIDMAFDERGRYLHVLNAGTQSIATFRVAVNGTLHAVGTVSGLPATANGLAAF